MDMTLKGSNYEASVLKIWAWWSTPSMTLHPGLFWAGVVISVSVLLMDQIDWFKNYSYLIGLCVKRKCC